VGETLDRAAVPAATPGATAGGAGSAGARFKAYAVHVFTASGVVCAFLATAEVCSPTVDPRVVILWLALQVLIDAADGPLARMWQVKTRVPWISGRTIDDIVDYLTYTFVPLLLVWRMGWLPEPAAIWVAPAMMASLFGFANAGAKDEVGGFFLGFPSYWNIVAVYVGVMYRFLGPWPGAALVVALTVLTVLPVRFVYPNLAPRPWRVPTIVGAGVWAALLVWMVIEYAHPPAWLVWVSLVYPVYYVAISVYLDRRTPRQRREISGAAE
jgi:phosphatidylcholine synthase